LGAKGDFEFHLKSQISNGFTKHSSLFLLQSKISLLVTRHFSMKAIAGYLGSLFEREFFFTGLKTALFVGTSLFTINHGGALLRGAMDRERWISGLLTYLMPYCLNVHGQYIARRRL